MDVVGLVAAALLEASRHHMTADLLNEDEARDFAVAVVETVNRASAPTLRRGIGDDLSVLWDPEASRVARVLVSRGRIEIVLTEPDPEWADRALAVMTEVYPEIVVASPGAG